MDQVFHFSLFKKCIGDPVVVVPIEGIDFQNSHSYKEILVKILDYQIRRLRNKEVPLVKVLGGISLLREILGNPKQTCGPSILTSSTLIQTQLKVIVFLKLIQFHVQISVTNLVSVTIACSIMYSCIRFACIV